MEEIIKATLSDDTPIVANVSDNEPINLTISDSMDITQELYITDDNKLGITYGNVLEKLPYDDTTDLKALYILSKGEN